MQILAYGSNNQLCKKNMEKSRLDIKWVALKKFWEF